MSDIMKDVLYSSTVTGAQRDDDSVKHPVRDMREGGSLKPNSPALRCRFPNIVRCLGEDLYDPAGELLKNENVIRGEMEGRQSREASIERRRRALRR